MCYIVQKEAKTMNIREFRNNFCKIAERGDKITVTKRNKVIGAYIPKKIKEERCERYKFNNVKCVRTARIEVMVRYVDKTIRAKLCNNCYKLLNSSIDSTMEIEVLNEM